MTNTPDFAGHKFVPPVQAGEGGTQCGNSYLTSWATCPRLFYNNYYRPTQVPSDVEGEPDTLYRGITGQFKSEYLLGGSIFHEGIAAWYRSGCRNGEDTGEYDIDHAMDVLNTNAVAAAAQYAGGPAKAEDDRVMFQVLMRSYADRYGPTSPSPDWPEIRILCDAKSGEPLIEQAYAFPLGNGYTYTCRIDAIIMRHGNVSVMEHKTTTAYGIRFRLESMPWDAQFAGELWTLQHALPELPIHGVYVNICLKKRSSTSKFDIATREMTVRTDGQLERWKEGAKALLRQIDNAVERYEQAMYGGLQANYSDGLSHEEAADAFFPDTGTRTGHCTAYGGCEYQELCAIAGMEHRALNQFRPRLRVETDRQMENPK